LTTATPRVPRSDSSNQETVAYWDTQDLREESEALSVPPLVGP
jgi:hypothetical protein